MYNYNPPVVIQPPGGSPLLRLIGKNHINPKTGKPYTPHNDPGDPGRPTRIPFLPNAPVHQHNPVAKAALDKATHHAGVSSPPSKHPVNPRTNQKNQPMVKASKMQTSAAITRMLSELTGGGSKLGSIHVALPNVPTPSTVDPKMWANSLVEAQYGPIVAEIHRQMQATDRASTVNLANLNAGYSTLAADEEARAGQNAAAAKAETADIGNLGTSFANSLGITDPNVLSNITGDTAIQQAYSRMMGDSGAEMSRNLLTAVGQDKMSAIQGEQARVANAKAELGGDLQTTLGERGSRLLELTQSAKEGNDAARQQTFENQMSRATMQGNVAQANADLQTTALKNKMAKIQLGVELANIPQDQLERTVKLAGMRADIAAQKKSTSLMGKSTPAQKLEATMAKANMNKEQRQNVQQVLMGVHDMVKWKNGAWRVGLEGTWKRINAAIQTSGLKPGTPAYKAAQRQAAALAGIQLGPKGNPIGRTPYHKPKKK